MVWVWCTRMRSISDVFRCVPQHLQHLPPFRNRRATSKSLHVCHLFQHKLEVDLSSYFIAFLLNCLRQNHSADTSPKLYTFVQGIFFHQYIPKRMLLTSEPSLLVRNVFLFCYYMGNHTSPDFCSLALNLRSFLERKGCQPRTSRKK